ncbi:enoyl-CoA hydratase-like protein [Saccharata proteae CBS 121410]|uniref:Enoyl-CoA hydratase-like protein n=1 Tax=Saccharata proteae CBS 121410 TaxID=1314787 RepID=A0A9P4LXB2_9PEZI|nr:enoyl-CoA hydratase-like protein [Saccharata proteae CBS 121410]
MPPPPEPTFTRPPPSPLRTFLLTYPAPHVLLVTINRPAARNSIPAPGHWEADAVFRWFDREPGLRVAVVTGVGERAFCAGQDLVGELERDRIGRGEGDGVGHPASGFCGLSRRTGKKPVVAAVNGFALGGGMEICLNCDLVVASPTATFGLPEVHVGLYAAAGGLPRLVRTIGMQKATELALLGTRLSAPEALSLHLINRISKTRETVVEEAVQLAKEIAANNPDAVIVTRAGLREAWECGSVERATQVVGERWGERLVEGENFRRGLEAFVGKKKAEWVDSKL